MYDDLSRIESIYGSVAEYNRVKWEEENTYEPTEEELEEDRISMEVYYAKIEKLNGEPSQFATDLIAEWNAKAPKEEDFADTNQYIYAGYDYAHDETLDMVSRTCKHYGLTADEAWNTFYQPEDGKFAISVEYHEHGRILSKNIGNLDLETFKTVFRDLHEMGLYPTMNYRKNGKNNIVSNSSLGSIRYGYLTRWDVETEQAQNGELSNAGFDENTIRQQFVK